MKIKTIVTLGNLSLVDSFVTANYATLEATTVIVGNNEVEINLTPNVGETAKEFCIRVFTAAKAIFVGNFGGVLSETTNPEITIDGLNTVVTFSGFTYTDTGEGRVPSYNAMIITFVDSVASEEMVFTWFVGGIRQQIIPSSYTDQQQIL